MNVTSRISASLWSADLCQLGSEIRRVDQHVECYHFDVADGSYMKNLLFFPDQLHSMRALTKRCFEVHLITKDPLRWVRPFADAGADRFIYYPHTLGDVGRAIELTKDCGCEFGLSLAPEDEVSSIEPFIGESQVICVMGSDVDRKGVQNLECGTLEKIKEIEQIRDREGLDFLLEADGAIREHTVPDLVHMGVDLLVAGSLLFKNDPGDIKQWINSIN